MRTSESSQVKSSQVYSENNRQTRHYQLVSFCHIDSIRFISWRWTKGWTEVWGRLGLITDLLRICDLVTRVTCPSPFATARLTRCALVSPPPTINTRQPFARSQPLSRMSSSQRVSSLALTIRSGGCEPTECWKKRGSSRRFGPRAHTTLLAHSSCELRSMPHQCCAIQRW